MVVPGARYMPRRILAADDSRTMRDMLSCTLAGAGFEVVAVEDGLKALDSLTATRFDLVITDINMPNLDGMSLITHIRASARHVGLPILILTTESSTEAKAVGRAAGATGWIVKPFSPEKLVALVDKVCPARVEEAAC